MTGEILEHLLLRCDNAYEFWIYAFFYVGRIWNLSTFMVGLGLERRRIREKLGLFRGCVNSI